MRFRRRASLDEYLLMFFIGCAMIAAGLSSTDKGWAVIGGILVVATLIFAATDLYRALQGAHESSPKPLPAPILIPLCVVAVPGLAAYWYLTGDVIALLLAIILAVLLSLLFAFRNNPEVTIAKFTIGKQIPPNIDESAASPPGQVVATHKLEFTMKPGEGPMLRTDDGAPVPLDVAIESSEFPIIGKEGGLLSGVADLMRRPGLDLLREAADARPGQAAEVATGEIVSLLTGHRYIEAVAAADRAIATQRASALLMLRGQALLAIGAVEEALADFQAARQSGSAAGVEASIGAALYELGRTDEAITALEKGRGDAAASSATFYYLGEGYRSRGRDSEAQDAYEEAAARAIVELQYGTAWHRGTLPMALIRQGKLDPAQIAADDAIKASPTDPTVKVALALIEVKRGTAGSAAAPLEEALAVNPYEVVRSLGDPDFAPLLADAGGKALLERAKAASDATLQRVRTRGQTSV